MYTYGLSPGSRFLNLPIGLPVLVLVLVDIAAPSPSFPESCSVLFFSPLIY